MTICVTIGKTVPIVQLEIIEEKMVEAFRQIRHTHSRRNKKKAIGTKIYERKRNKKK